jgi:hypothetical protein
VSNFCQFLADIARNSLFQKNSPVVVRFCSFVRLFKPFGELRRTFNIVGALRRTFYIVAAPPRIFELSRNPALVRLLSFLNLFFLVFFCQILSNFCAVSFVILREMTAGGGE